MPAPMSGSRERRRQKKLEKNKKKRNIARQRATGGSSASFGSKAWIRSARTAPFGPAWISAALDDVAGPTALITVVVTRRMGSGVLLPELALVDRTCLGVKNAFVMKPAGELDMPERIRLISEKEPLRPCDPLVAQSVVFHALDYAQALGFGPHRDFERALFEPRPEVLAETPLARPERPLFVSGPRDNVPRILQQLDAAVGRDGYHFVALEQQLPGSFLDDGEEEELGGYG